MNPYRAATLLSWANTVPPQELYTPFVWLSLWQDNPGYGRAEVRYENYRRMPVPKERFVVEQGGPLDQPAGIIDVPVNVPDYPDLTWIGLSLVEATLPVLWAKLEAGAVRGSGGMLSIDPGMRFVFEVGQ